MDKVERYSYTADTFHCDFNHELCIGHLGNAMLNAADVHSTRRNFGMTYLNTIHKTWVLSRLALELDELPVEHTPLCIETWVENALKFFTKRNWCIKSEDGEKVYGYGKSVWAMIDTETREPQNILAVNDGKILDYIYPEKPCDIKDVSRVKTPEMTDNTAFKVKYSDLDVNGHLNSMKYVEHVLDTLPAEHYNKFRVKRIEIAYVLEAHFGEEIRIYNKVENGTHYFCLCRIEDDGKQTELCRVSVVFAEKKYK